MFLHNQIKINFHSQSTVLPTLLWHQDRCLRQASKRQEETIAYITSRVCDEKRYLNDQSTVTANLTCPEKNEITSIRMFQFHLSAISIYAARLSPKLFNYAYIALQSRIYASSYLMKKNITVTLTTEMVMRDIDCFLFFKS